MVAIKDMEMPKNCAYCRFRIYGRCYITDTRIDNYNCPQIKDSDCPLVDIKDIVKEELRGAKLQQVYNKGFEDCRQAVIDTIYNDQLSFMNIFACEILIDKIKDLSLVNPQEPKTEKVMMRDATPEEQKSVYNYIKSISKPTGVNFGTLEKKPCKDAVSRQEIIEHYTTGEMANVHHIDKNHLLAFVEQLSPVTPQ